MKRLLLIAALFLSVPSWSNQALKELNQMLSGKPDLGLQAEAKQELRRLQEDYYFILIYKSNCPHCHNFAPILADFSKHFKVEVKSFSIDGGKLSPFQGEALPPELFRTFFLSSGFKPIVPALFLVNSKINQAYPVLFGEAQAYQLANRVHELMSHIKEQFS